MTIRMVVSDLDGTLLGADGELATETIAELERVRKRGVTVVAATGRAPHSAMARVGSTGVVDVLVCSNGSIVHDPWSDRTTRRRTIEAVTVAAMFDAFDAALPELAYCWELPDRYGWDTGFEHIGTTHEDTRMHEGAPRPSLTDEVTKVMVLHPRWRRLELRDRLAPLLPAPLTLGCSGVEFVEVTGADVNKATTVADIAAERSIDASEVIAFGDNANDLEMLTWAGTGAAVANAVGEAIDAADITIGHHDDLAVARHLAAIIP